MSELKAFVMKVQGTYDYSADLAQEHARYNAVMTNRAELDQIVAKQATDAAWKRFINENRAR